MISVLEPGLLTTVQDEGRYHLSHLGISPGGSADPVSSRFANLLVGNSPSDAVLEMTLRGGLFFFEEPAVIAVTGSDFHPVLEGKIVPLGEAIRVEAGQTLAFGATTEGARAYLAVRGGLDVPRVLSSRSTLLSAGFGGYEGRGLRKGDRLKIFPSEERPLLKWKTTPAYQSLALVRYTGEAALEEGEFTVTEQSNRSGLRLTGASLSAESGKAILSEGVTWGTLQLPSPGAPVILMNEQQTTGGYAKIGQVIRCDLATLGQLKPRDRIRFKRVDFDEAIALLREQNQKAESALVPTRIDLNLDAGEDPSSLDSGREARLYPLVTRVNIACGGHAGDPQSMALAVKLASQAGIEIGAHPSYPDKAGFGRAALSVDPDDVSQFVRGQVLALKTICDERKVALRHVKPHGALYHQVAIDQALARAFARGVGAVDPNLVLVGPAGSAALETWREEGFATMGEAFADRRYHADGSLVPRGKADSLITDPFIGANQAWGLLRDGTVETIEGKKIAVSCATVCVHGDNPGAEALLIALARRWRL